MLVDQRVVFHLQGVFVSIAASRGGRADTGKNERVAHPSSSFFKLRGTCAPQCGQCREKLRFHREQRDVKRLQCFYWNEFRHRRMPRGPTSTGGLKTRIENSRLF